MPSASRNEKLWVFRSRSVEDFSEENTDPNLSDYSVLEKYALELPKASPNPQHIPLESSRQSDAKYLKFSKGIVCFPIAVKLVQEEETRESVFEECELPVISDATKKEQSISLEVSEQHVLHPQNKCTHDRSYLQIAVEEETRQSIFEECELPVISNITQKEESIARNETPLLFRSRSVKDFSEEKQSPNSSEYAALDKYDLESPKVSTNPKHLPLESRRQSVPRYLKFFKTTVCIPKTAELVGEEEETIQSVFEECELPITPDTTMQEESISVEVSEQQYLLHPQNRCNQIQNYLQTVLDFLRFNLRCRK
ncbi:hypothetical protein NPIL_104321 [Nephila pilipes]|uniref:Uncharacterized protein n=1 Tax=Nephila pilipes TaxID=299642 RepID=A0A8X6TZ22_NEPPI|nr:hypothetical protein NPIL_104321 [Nephila pilipes]